jgi:hypothetical protein
MAVKRVGVEGLDKDPKIASRFAGQLDAYAMVRDPTRLANSCFYVLGRCQERTAYYLCDTCRNPFFGGLAECDAAGAPDGAAAADDDDGMLMSSY